MKGELRRFGHRPHEHQQAEQQGGPWGDAAVGQPLLKTIGDALEIEAAGGPEQPEDAEQQPEVTNPVHHEGFLRRVGCTVAVVPETDEQIGTHAHQLPEHIDLPQVRADDQPEHRAAEQGQIGEEADIALVVGHVAMGIDHHQKGNGGHQGQHHGAQ